MQGGVGHRLSGRVGIAGLRDCFLAERERWPLWGPVLIAAGIALYFALPWEPALWTGAALFCAAITGAFVGRRVNGVTLCAVAFALAAAGFLAAQIRTQLVAAPVLEKNYAGTVSGRVLQVEEFESGPRVLLDHVSLKRLPPDRTPRRVRVKLRRSDRPAVGSRIEVFARLMPPGGPSAPGAYDFQRHAWYERIGAVGFAYGAMRTVDAVGGVGPAIRVAQLRHRVSARVRAAISDEAGAVAAALMTGDRCAIPQDVISAMRDSGLAHLLAISGLHMGLVVATLFFGLRALLALHERLALRYPVKKWAAAIAMIGGVGYLVLTGATIPTQRAFLMTALVLLAVLLDRTAISLRLVAWAAAAILLLSPESLLGASFQMSFAAVVALVSVYEGLRGRALGWLTAGPLRKLLLYFGGVALTTLVAGVATGIFALYHFGRITHFGLAANLVAVPVTAFWIMPWGVIAMALMPYGLEWVALTPMAWGIDLVVAVARTVAAWPGSVSLTPAMPVAGLAAAAFGGLWLCLWRRRWRYAGLAGIVAGVASIGLHTGPDILVSADGELMAVRAPDGDLVLSSTRREKRTAQTWLARSGQREPLDWGSGAVRCDELACIYRKRGRIVALVSDPRALEEDCRHADIVVSAVPVRWQCPSARLVVDRFDLWRYGSYAIWLARDGPRAVTVAERQGDRPWSPRRPPPRRKSVNSGAAIRSAALGP